MGASGWVDLLRRTFLGPGGTGGRVVMASTLAGGICCGGLLVGSLALLGLGSVGLHLLVAPVLFLAGSALGVVHGVSMAVVARPETVTCAGALRRALIATALTLPLVPLSWLVSSSIVVSAALRSEVRASWVAVSVVGTLLGLVVCTWAMVESGRAVAAAWGRWTARTSRRTRPTGDVPSEAERLRGPTAGYILV